jgi:hypothetical protein
LVASAVAVPFRKSTYTETHYPAQYEYEYSVLDEHNGDVKQQKENRDGDTVRGYYSFIQPDGVKRIVEYTVDKDHGFNAVVRYEGQPKAGAAPMAKVTYPVSASKITYAAPPPKVNHAADVAYAAPVAYAAAPVAKVAYASPAHVAYAPIPHIAYAGQVGHVSYLSPAFSYHH